METTLQYEKEILRQVFAKHDIRMHEIVRENALQRVVWASGRVRRALLNISSLALEGLDRQTFRIYVASVNEASARHLYNKQQELDTEFVDSLRLKEAVESLKSFCMKLNKVTAFLVTD